MTVGLPTLVEPRHMHVKRILSALSCLLITLPLLARGAAVPPPISVVDEAFSSKEMWRIRPTRLNQRTYQKDLLRLSLPARALPSPWLRASGAPR